MQKVLFVLYLLYELAQAAAITLGIQFYFDADILVAAPAGIIIALIPLVGTAAAIVGLMLVLDVHWMVATSAYALPGLLILALAMLGEARESKNTATKKSPETKTGVKAHNTKPIKRVRREDDF